MTDSRPEDPDSPAADGRAAPPTDHRHAWARVAAIALVTVAAVYALRLGDQVIATHRAERAERDLATEVGIMGDEVSALQTAAAAAQSDAAVERWAREERGWAREGDRVLVVAAPTVTAMAPEAAVQTDRRSPWQRLTGWLGDRVRR